MIPKKEMVEQRQHKRFQVPKGTFVGLGPHDTKVGQIIRYVGSEEPSNGELDIFLNERDFYLGRVPFRTVSDFEITSRRDSSSTAMRRSGVQFRKMKPNQISQLEYFIQNHTLGEA
ncbi:MAG: hypothetical protein JRJ17_03390 [Deltaproteobacteria bacterium]|nr:hypothetical protein [Deltaproteobacteria bacterium]